MQLTREQEKAYLKRILVSRLRILCKQGFYGSLLMHMSFALDNNIKNVSVDKKKIYFNPEFLDRISNQELDFVLLHEILHVSLKHNFRRRVYADKEVFDKAADIVVNSNILKSFDDNRDAISLDGEIQNHLSPENKEGYEYSTEELYKLLVTEKVKSGGYGSRIDEESLDISESFDDHSKWDEEDYDELDEKEWEKYNLDACEMMYIRDPSNSRGTIPGYAARAFMELRQAKTDWRTLLNNFIQEEVNDYSFTPPDRRFSDNDFFLPDFNDRDEEVKGVIFMIDTSGSMSDKQITDAYSEVKGAIDQFGGKLQGWLGFFDAAIIEPKEFTTDEELKIIHPYGGGGTSFTIIFDYVNKHMQDKNISSIVILTDGYAPWPREDVTDIPTIWLINNEEVTPPWGKVARILDNKE